MKRQSELLERQNDEEALTLLRASVNCLNNERRVKYLMIFMSFSVCLAAIFNRYLPQMLPNVGNIVEIQENIATYINLISGVVLVLGIVLGFYVARMHVEGTSLQDRYEAYVFDNAANFSILRPISKAMIEIYAKKTRWKKDAKFLNNIYSPDDTPSATTAQFDYICNEVRSDYKLYIYIQPFFLTIWIGFCILVMIIAVSFNDKFITTLINILIPSLSAISTIASSWKGCRLQIRQLQNLLNIIDNIQSMPESKKMLYITDKSKVRLLADGLFEYRVSPFVIPEFLKRRFRKSVKAYNNVGSHTAAMTETAATHTPSETVKTQKISAPKTVSPVQSAQASAPKTTVSKTPAVKTGKPAVSQTKTTSNAAKPTTSANTKTAGRGKTVVTVTTKPKTPSNPSDKSHKK